MRATRQAARLALRASGGPRTPCCAPLLAARALSSAPDAGGGEWRRGSAVAACGAAAAALLVMVQCASAEAQPPQPNLPVYTRAEVAAHASREKRVWVTHKDGVYDVTDFLSSHPGGAEKLLMAAGGSVDAYWQLYPQHLRAPAVAEALRAMRVGTLSAAEAAEAAAELPAGDPYRNDPGLHPALRVHARAPATAEPPLTLLAHAHVTPAELWYVRSHHPVPSCGLVPAGEAGSHEVRVSGPGGTVTLTVDELRARFPRREVTATMQCGGNRRGEMNGVRSTAGIAWGAGAIATATWAGAALTDVLAAAGLPPGAEAAEAAGVAHVIFTGADGMSASVPASRACDPSSDVLLAYEMNGAPLPAHHGAPLRAVVPGVVGVRSVKWLVSVAASAEEAAGPWQRGMAYKSFPPHQLSLAPDADTAALPSVQEQPVTSAIASPAEGAALPLTDGCVTLRGYAWSGGGRAVQRVEVSLDGGESWASAQLLPPTGAGGEPLPPQRDGRAWAWRLWEATLALPAGAKAGDALELVCKATDEAQNGQPERVAPVWNLRGLNCNAWHRVRVVLVEEE